MELKDIKELIKFVSKSGVNEVQLEKDDFKIVIKTGAQGPAEGSGTSYIQMMPSNQPAPGMMVPAQQQPGQQPPSGEAPAGPAAATEPPLASNHVEIKAPMVGTFYRSAGPDKDPFVKVGDNINKGDVVCIIEAMKLFNEIEAEISGKVVKVIADDASPVEFDQPLFILDPS
ncbi:MAG: acetyl-CoA carboxylase biotin carboxyl carrier protein [Bacteroidia bacterium]